MKITARSIGYRRIMLNLKPATHRAWDDFRVHVSEVINFPLYMYSSVKKSFSCLSLGLIFLLTLTFSVEAMAQNPWPMFRQNSFHTGSTNFTGPLAPDIAWQYNTAGFTYSSPIVSTDRVYIASENELIALNLDGDEEWVFTFAGITQPGAVEITGFVSTPAIGTDGTIYIGSLDNNLYAINPNGSLRWTFDMGDQIFASPTVGPDGTIYVGSRSGQLFAMNADGSVRWSASTSGEIFSSATVSPDGRVFVGTTASRLYGFAPNGGLLWTAFQAQGEIISSPALGNNNVYFGSLDGNVYAVNISTGQSAWATPFNTGSQVVSSPAVGTDGTVYIGSFDRRFYAINGSTGAPKWNEPLTTGASIAASPAIDGFGNIYIPSLDGTMYVLSDATSRFDLLWSFPTGSPIWSSAAIGLNRVYVAATGSQSEPGRLFAIDQAVYTLVFAQGLIAGQDAPFNVSITGAPVAALGTLFCRAAGDANFTALPFTGNAIIPGTGITGAGLEYYIEGLEGTFPADSPQQRPASQRVFINNDFAPDVFLPRIHRMISVPYNLTSKSITDVLVDDYADYGPQNWRLHRWNGNDFEEYPSLNDRFEPGNAFFLITALGDVFDVDSGWSVDTSQPYSITLQPGWNQIGVPFGFPVLWSRVIRNTELVNAIAFFNGGQMIQDPEVVDRLIPWEGYFVYNASNEALSILIPPEPAPPVIEEPPIEEEDAGKSAGKSSMGTARMQISASIDGRQLEDTQNWVGFAPEASSGIDVYDILEAPPFGENIRLSIMDEGKPFAVNMRPTREAGTSWDFSLTTSVESVITDNQPVTFTFTPQGAWDTEMNLVLVDQDYGFAKNIVGDQIEVDWGDRLTTRNFRLITGSPQYLEQMLDDTPVAPSETSLSQNFPNPFQQHTRINYQLSDRQEVKLVIYNMLGQEVQSLVHSTQNPGQYEVIWNGLDQANRPVASGMYVYQLRAGAFSATGKMALVR